MARELIAAPCSDPLVQLPAGRPSTALEVEAGAEDGYDALVARGRRARDGCGAADCSGCHVAQILIHIHDIGLHRQARSDGVGRTAAIGLVGGGIVSGFCRDVRAALEAFSVRVSQANSHRSCRVADPDMPGSGLAGSSRVFGNGIVVAGINVATTQLVPAVTQLRTGLPSHKILKRRTSDSSQILTGSAGGSYARSNREAIKLAGIVDAAFQKSL